MTDENNLTDNQKNETVIKSKTQVKKELLDITSFGEKLIGLSENALKSLPLQASIFEAILDAKQMKRIALKRQIGYIGKLLRNEDIDDLKNAIYLIENKEAEDTKIFHKIERLREALLDENEGKKHLEDFFSNYPDTERQALRQLIIKIKKERQNNKDTKKSYRQLFQLLKITIKNHHI